VKRLLTCALLACALAATARADDHDGSLRPRATAYFGLPIVVGPEVTTNGQGFGNPANLEGIPIGDFGLRFELPIAARFVLGAHASLLVWQTEQEAGLGFDSHTTFDLGASARMRHVWGWRPVMELSGGLLGGPSIDGLSPRPEATHLSGSTDKRVVGLHVGGVGAFGLSWPRSPWGVAFEGALIYHRLTREIRYPTSELADEVIYQPIVVSLRVGAVLHF
jgi:hypothetical protein